MLYECAGSAPNSQPSIQCLAGPALHMLRVLTQHPIAFRPARAAPLLLLSNYQSHTIQHTVYMPKQHKQLKSWKQSASLTHRAGAGGRRPTSKTVSASKVVDLLITLLCSRKGSPAWFQTCSRTRTEQQKYSPGKDLKVEVGVSSLFS